MSKNKDPLQETLKFGLRIGVFALPLIINALTDAGLTEWAGLFSAILALADKYIHLSPDVKANGLLPF